MLPNKTTTNDFNLPVAFSPFPHKGLADKYRANRFFSNHGHAPSLGFPQMRQTISWRSQNTKILLHGPLSLYGIRSINLPGELARHQSMPARQPVKTLSYGHSIPHLTKHISRRQRKSRLANLRRLRPNPSIAKDLYAKDDFGINLQAEVYALDSTTIDLCLSLFPWARFRKTKGAIKLHLRIKAFYGTSANVVKTQVWIAVSVYLLVAILKKKPDLDQSLYAIPQFLSVSIFEKTPISEAFSQEFYKTKMSDHDNQLLLFNL